MSEKKTIFSNEIVDGKLKIPFSKEKSFGFVYPAAAAVLVSTIGDENVYEIMLSEAISEQDYDLAPLTEGKIEGAHGFEKKYHLVNYELGRIRLPRKLAESLMQNLKRALDQGS